MVLLHLPKVDVVVDVFDEMDQGKNIDFFFLQPLLKLAHWRPIHVKILLTSGPVLDIERARRMEVVLRLKLEERMADVGIASYIRYQANRSESCLSKALSMQL
jgi:hypothetical protein